MLEVSGPSFTCKSFSDKPGSAAKTMTRGRPWKGNRSSCSRFDSRVFSNESRMYSNDEGLEKVQKQPTNIRRHVITGSFSGYMSKGDSGQNLQSIQAKKSYLSFGKIQNMVMQTWKNYSIFHYFLYIAGFLGHLSLYSRHRNF